MLLALIAFQFDDRSSRVTAFPAFDSYRIAAKIIGKAAFDAVWSVLALEEPASGKRKPFSKSLSELHQRPLPFAVITYVEIGEYGPWFGAIEAKLSLLPGHFLK